jgi:hypothetical protein
MRRTTEFPEEENEFQCFDHSRCQKFTDLIKKIAATTRGVGYSDCCSGFSGY